MPRSREETEAEVARSFAIGLLALFWLVLAGLWNGIASNVLWALALVLVVFAGLFMVRAGALLHEVFLPTLGSGLLLAVVVPFVIHLAGGGADPGGPWVPVAAAVASPFVAVPRLGTAERLMGLLGAFGVVLIMVQPLRPGGLDLTVLTVSALLLMVALSVAAAAPPDD